MEDKIQVAMLCEARATSKSVTGKKCRWVDFSLWLRTFSNQTSLFPHPLSFLPEDLVKVRWPPARHAHECSMRALKSIHGVHWPGFRAALMALWVGSCLKRAGGAGMSAGLPACGRDCASRHSCLVFCGGPWRMERASLKHTGLLSSSPPPACTSRPC